MLKKKLIMKYEDKAPLYKIFSVGWENLEIFSIYDFDDRTAGW